VYRRFCGVHYVEDSYMANRRHSYALVTVTVLFLSALATGIGCFWLWREYTLWAIILSAFLLFGGATMLPERNTHAHAASLGLCIGVFIGGVFGAAALFGAII
jgi:hypothetical protein